MSSHRDDAKREVVSASGLRVWQKWWVRAADDDARPDAPMADFSADVVAAPPVYDPGGPVLMVRSFAATANAVDGLVAFGGDRDVAVVVVPVTVPDPRRDLLRRHGFHIASEWYRPA